MNISEILNIMNSENIDGLQLSKRNGTISTTWLLYKQEDYYFYFDINQKIEFKDEYKYSEKEILQEFANAHYLIELSIS